MQRTTDTKKKKKLKWKLSNCLNYLKVDKKLYYTKYTTVLNSVMNQSFHGYTVVFGQFTLTILQDWHFN